MINLWNSLIDLIAPRVCAICGNRLAGPEQAICGACNRHLPRTDHVLTPLDNPLCRLYWKQMPVGKAAAWFYYSAGSPAGRAIYALKYHHQADIGRLLGEMMAREFQAEGFFEGIELLVPVPLTRGRQRQRGYNQSLLIAEGVSHITGIPIADKALRRVRFDGSQTQNDIEARRQNVKDAFQLRHPEHVKGRHLLLIDDVVTTGATTLSCARELAKAGGVTVSVLSLGFVRP